MLSDAENGSARYTTLCMASNKFSNCKEAALHYAKRGWHVFPVHSVEKGVCSCRKTDCERAGKHPRTPHGLKDATVDKKQIEAWWKKWPSANVAIRTGKISGLAVLDCDGGSEESLKQLSIPHTYTVTTQSGGLHYYFQIADEPVGNRVRFLPGLDLRAKDGYVVAPPSIGMQGQYDVVEENELAEAPAWLLATKSKAAVPVIKTSGPVGVIAEGGRNDYLTRKAGKLRRGNDLTFESLMSLNLRDCEPPLSTEEVAIIYESIMNKAPAAGSNGNNPLCERELLPRIEVNGKMLYPTEPVVRYWLDRPSITYHYQDDTVTVPGINQRTNIEGLLTRILCDANNVLLKLDKDLVQRVVVQWLAEKRELHLDEYRKWIAYDGAQPTEDHAARFIRALKGVDSEIDAAVLRHFIWQVKRKLLKIPVERHMMVVLYGAQNIGKSVAANKLFEPVGELVGNLPSLSTLNDSRELRLLSKNYVLFVDEMARSQQVDVKILKNTITSSHFSQRVMRFTEHVTLPNNATFFGCSNEDLQDLIWDTTGVRRFWQITCAEKVDWKRINTLNYRAMWLSVDENAPPPILPFASQIFEKQHDEFRNKDTVEHFIESQSTKVKRWTLAGDAYQLYRTWCEENGFNSPLTSHKFGKRLKVLVPSSRASDGVQYELAIHAPPGIGKLLTIGKGK